MRLGITGHQNLPDDITAYVTAHLSEFLQPYEAVVGITNLAEGADQLFAEAVLAQGGTIEAIIPARDYRNTFGTEFARQRYDTLLARASSVRYLAFDISGEDAYMAAGEEVVRLCEHLIAVWDGQPSRGKGGTADVAQFANDCGIPVTILWPAGRLR